MKSELSSQINSLTWQLADLIEKENSLIADWGYRLEAYDREAPNRYPCHLGGAETGRGWDKGGVCR